jgi:NAD(P)-dependent dehydrogenase (short-subunit alcohol dehydrogenase family)
MSVSFDFTDRVALVTGASGALGSAVATAFRDAGATVAAVDIVAPDDEDARLDAGEGIAFYEADLTDESDVERVVDGVVDDHGRLDHLLNVAGTWRGGTPIHETDESTYDLLFDVNLRTAFLTSKHALPHLHEREGSIVSVSARSSLSGGEGDGLYRAAKAGIRLLTGTLAEENEGVVRANAVMPSVIDTPANREAMPDANHGKWVDPAEIADVMLFLCSEGAGVTSGAAVPVYGEA